MSKAETRIPQWQEVNALDRAVASLADNGYPALAASAREDLDRLRTERADAKSDVARLHKDKCDYLDALIACRIALKDDGDIGAAITIINKACPIHDR